MPDIYLVVGGSGFVGRHIVQQLVDRGDTVSVLDLVQRYHDVPFYSADITDQAQVAAALRTSGTTCIIHTASPVAAGNKAENPELFWRVNVGGTKAIIAAALETGVRKLVYTSSAGVVFNGADLIDVDERASFPPKMDAYNESKAKAEEAVLEANGKGGLLTVALRPAGIFGPGDRQAMQGLAQVFERGQTNFQIGDNNNIFDWTYVGNVAYAHLLAADRLTTPPPAPLLADLPEMPKIPEEVPPLTHAEEAIVSFALPSINLTIPNCRIPTSEARPLGPCITPPPNAEQLVAAFNDPTPLAGLPVARTRFDPFSEYTIARTKLHAPNASPLQVAGQAFFITNGEPLYFWDFARIVWHHLGEAYPEKKSNKGLWVLPKQVGMLAATGAEWWAWLVGRKDPTFTRFKVSYSCATRWHNIEKARRVLGYEPQVGVEEGVVRMIQWWTTEGRGKQ
ncbi:C-3 sterol dehydrogenase [Mycena rebaudengoi]|nr:C-3 sterol dehydrogenase [Mycena rebaudengoi]